MKHTYTTFTTEIFELMKAFDKAKSVWVEEFGSEKGFNEWALKHMISRNINA